MDINLLSENAHAIVVVVAGLLWPMAGIAVVIVGVLWPVAGMSGIAFVWKTIGLVDECKKISIVLHSAMCPKCPISQMHHGLELGQFAMHP